MNFFILVELLKYYVLDNSMLFPTTSWVYAAKMTTLTNLGYFIDIFGAEDITNKTAMLIKGVIIDYETRYSLAADLATCQSTEFSFYFDSEIQVLYIHFDHDISPYAHVIEYGKVLGFTNDKIRTFNEISYLPEVLVLPKLNIKIDDFIFSKLAYYGGNLIINNNNREFDSDYIFTGNDVFIYFGEDGDAYGDLILIANNFVTNSQLSFSELNLIIKDKREQQSEEILTDTFSLTDYPDIDPDLVGTIKPDAWGYCKGVPGICVNSQSVTKKKFYFASVITNTPTPVFYTNYDEEWQVVTADSIDYANGTATFLLEDTHVFSDDTKGILDLKCDAVFNPETNPADIIAELNDRFLDITYNSTNYDTSEWTDEKQYLDDIGFYLNESKDINDVIEKIQNMSTVNFQYMFYDGKRTIRLDNPNRVDSFIDNAHILNPIKIGNDNQNYASSVIINYNKDYTDDKFREYRNDDYSNESIQIHRKANVLPLETGLKTEDLAIDKSIIFLEDLYKDRFVTKLLFSGKDFYNYRLLDILTIELSYNGEKNSNGEIINQRTFLGEQRMKIIGLSPNFRDGTIMITLKQCEFSQNYEDITGYTT